MQYGKIPGVKKPFSRLILGAVNITRKELEKSFALLDSALAAGYNAIDLAHGYGGGEVERTMGAWLEARNNREQVIVITKGAHQNSDRKRVTPYDINSDMADSLARLKTSYIDLYLLHRDDPSVPVGPIMDVLNEHHAAGRILAFGGSNWSHQRIAEANEYAQKHDLVQMVASSPNFSLADQVKEPWADCTTISGKSGEAARQWYAKNQMPLLAWSSLARGFFSGRITKENFEEQKKTYEACAVSAYFYPENLERLVRVDALAKQKNLTVPLIALAYVLQQPMNLFAMVGAATPEEVQKNLDVFTVKLTAAEMAHLRLES
jgi:aryl-alcohol dehydrogenase-like predicted oxidoreductase